MAAGLGGRRVRIKQVWNQNGQIRAASAYAGGAEILCICAHLHVVLTRCEEASTVCNRKHGGGVGGGECLHACKAMGPAEGSRPRMLQVNCGEQGPLCLVKCTCIHTCTHLCLVTNTHTPEMSILSRRQVQPE